MLSKIKDFLAPAWAFMDVYGRQVVTVAAVLVVFANTLIAFVLLEKSDCQAQYNAANSKIISIRSGLAERADRNQNKLLSGVAKLAAEADALGRDPTQREQRESTARFRKLLSEFTSEAEKISVARKKNPVPAVPACASI